MKTGTKVTLKQPCGYEVCKYNPRNIEGVVIGENARANRYYTFTEGKFNDIIVEWSNGIRNSYTENQLIKI
jgi:hypothetical protein